MRLPTKIRVGPFTYTVVADKAAINAACREARDTRTGETDFNQLKIIIDPDLALDMLADTLLHETLHAIQCTVGIGSNEKMPAHEYIYRMSSVLLLTMRGNPEWLEFLTTET